MRISVDLISTLRTFVLLFLLTGCSAVASEAQTVYITKTGSKYHAVGCRYLSRSKIPVKLSIAKEQGYEPCSVCSPAEDEIAEEEEQPQAQRRDTVRNPVPVMRKPENKPTRVASPSQSAQCAAFTKAGARCKRTATANGKCWQHQ